MVLNLGTPLFIEHIVTISTIHLAQNIVRTTFIGNGTFMLSTPPSGRNVSTIDSGYRVTTCMRGLVRVTGQSLVKTIDGNESATIDYADILQLIRL